MSAYSENYKQIKWAPIKPAEPRATEAKGVGPYFVPDINEFIAPGYVRIDSRMKLREYERRTGTKQCGELKSATDFAPVPREPDKRRIGEAYRTALDKLGYL